MTCCWILISDLVKNAIHKILHESPRGELQQRPAKIPFTIIYALHVAGRTKKCNQCDQCVQCVRSVPCAAGRPVWRVRASSPIKKGGANYVGRPGSATRKVGLGRGLAPPPDYGNKLMMSARSGAW